MKKIRRMYLEVYDIVEKEEKEPQYIVEDSEEKPQDIVDE